MIVMKTFSCAIMGGNLQELPFFADSADSRTKKLKDMIIAHIIKLIVDDGVTYFMSSMELGAELYAAETVIALKRWFPDIRLECVFPHETQAANWPEYYRHKYYETAANCDKETFITSRLTENSYEMKDYYLISNADFVLHITNEAVILTKLIED